MTNTVKKVWVWILSFLKLKPQSHSIFNNVIPISSRQQRKKIKRDSTLKDLLDNLDYAFNEIKVDYHRWSHISKKQIKGLKRYGVSVIPGIERSIHKHDYKLENTTDMATDVINTSSLSSVIFIATNAHKSEDYLKDSDLVQPDFFLRLKNEQASMVCSS
jgi:DNA-directed RNA polymerase beta' subunit